MDDSYNNMDEVALLFSSYDAILPAEVENNLKFPLHMDYLVLF